MTAELQPAYILHTRPYRDTSMLVDLLTPDFGRVTAVARGVRARKTPKRNLLNPFSRLLVSFQGKTDLKLLTHFEAEGVQFSLAAKHLYSGFYINEVLVRLLPELDAHPEVFQLYEQCLQALKAQADLEPILRYFELQLLDALGYAIAFTHDANTGQALKPNHFYSLDVALGFYVSEGNVPANLSFCGQHLLAIAEQDFTLLETKQTAKRITRMLLKPLLGHKPLMSRELFS